MSDWETLDQIGGQEIAIIGMAGRFPGAQNLDEFWQNLVNGVEAISTFSDEQVLAAGVDPALVANPYYVKAGGVLKDVELFDAAFFGFYPREAALTDPQQRLFLECAWQALESAGYDPEAYDGPIGVYAGTGISTYLLFNLLSSPRIESTDQWAVVMNNDKDFLPTRVSYKLNLRGPSVNVQTACSTSLVAVHLACQSLLSYESDMALAGGSTIRIPQERGYLYQEGGIASPDGHCRAFDAQAHGTVGGNGVGVVVLKRLADALADGDYIHAVIKGSAINNDGSLKVGYTAPSVDGQSEVIARSMAMAQVDPATIHYIECHGTGTGLGDPIEIAALSQAFQSAASVRRCAGRQYAGQFCAIGSLKTNVGHMDTAAGVASLIKTALSLEHRQLPPSLHYSQPNPNIDFAATPFYVNAQLSEWRSDGAPRRAGVSSFGIGGTNAHVVLEEAPAREISSASRPWQALFLSAKTEAALEQATWNLTDHLMQHPDLNLADVAYTTQVGRRAFAHRRVIVCRDVEDVLRTVENRDPKRLFTGRSEPGERPVAFLFTGQGAQYVQMGQELYETEPVFRQQVDYCADVLRAHLGLDLRDLLYPPQERAEEAAERLQQTAITQPALFAIEYALARLWMAWGVQPETLIGHSIGEYTAACLAGIFSLEDALALVAARGRMMQALPAGSMLSVPLSEEEVRPYLDGHLSVAVLNAPGMSVVSGSSEAVDELAQRLTAAGVDFRRLHASHAFHSPMMEPILTAFAARVAQVELHAPTIPLISNVTGTWMTPDQATDPAYWASHLRQTVRFGQGVEELLKEPARVLLEVGPGQTLTTLVRRHPLATAERVVLSSLRHPKDEQPDVAYTLGTLGRLWLAGVRVDWAGFYADERRHRLPLPTYPFERQRYYIDLDTTGQARRKALRKEPHTQDWFYLPSWKRTPLPRPAVEEKGNWLLFGESGGLTAEMAARLRTMGRQVITVVPGGRFAQVDDQHYLLNPQEPGHYDRLLRALAATDATPAGIAYLWGMGHGEKAVPEALDAGFYPLLYLAQSWGRQPEAGPVEIDLITDGLHEVVGGEPLPVGAAPLLGLGRVIPQEFPAIRCRVVDVLAPEVGASGEAQLADWLARECLSGAEETVVAYRGRHRWVQAFERIPASKAAPEVEPEPVLRSGGVYLITGGLGRIGLTMAGQLAQRVQARLALVDRIALPPREDWNRWLSAHDETDATSARIQSVRACETLGAEVLLLQADVADRTQLAQAVAETNTRFGALYGVVHAAGIVGDAAVISLPATDRAACERQFGAKLYGSLALADALADRPLDFVLLMSSLSALLGGLGFAAYAGANACLDATAQRQRRATGVSWISVNWEGWRFAEEQGLPLGGEAGLFLTPEEGVAAFEYALTLREYPQVALSTGDLTLRLERVEARGERAVEEAHQTGEVAVQARPGLQTEYAAPRNDLERALAETWRKVLGIAQVGIHDDFFQLGGDSLLATQLISRVRDTYKMELPLRKLFEEPTVSGLAALIEAGSAEQAQTPGLQPIPRMAREGSLPLSFGQQRLWFLDRLEPDSPLYNNSAAVQVTGALDPAILGRCLNAVVQRHEVLRTTFGEVAGQPMQRVADELEMPLTVLDLRDLPATEREARVIELARQDGRQPFDLTQGPLMRVTLLQLAEREQVLLVSMHHIISDGWSVAVLIRELAALYIAFAAGRPSPLPELPIQYADWAAWQRAWMEGDALEMQVAYWKAQLGDLPPALELPTDHPRPAVQTAHGANAWFSLPPELSKAMEALSQREGSTLFMTLLAALQTLFYRYTGQEDICIGTPVANRNRSETEGLIGFLLNTLALRTDLSGNPTFREVLGRVREVALGAYAHQEVPFEALVEALHPRRDMSRAPLFQVMFDLQSAPLEALRLPDVTFRPLPVDNGTAKFDLALSMEQAEGGLRGYLNYNTDLFDPQTIERMLAHLLALLEGIVANPDGRIADLPLLTAEERQRIVVEWNRAASTGAPVETSVVSRFEAQVARTPEILAVTCDGSTLTYGELNRQANQLAHHLLQLGVGPEGMVGVCLERSQAAVVALLATLKAGGVYVPLDPGYPAERLAYMLEDARVTVLLTEQALAERALIRGLPAHRAQVVCLDADADAIAGQRADNLSPNIAAANLAYVIYTSGSTGAPKGVAVPHGALATHIRDVAGHYALTAGDRVLQFPSLNFDPSLEQILGALTVGATVVLRGRDLWSPDEFARRVAQERVTVANLPTAYWHHLTQAWGGNGGGASVNGLRLVIPGGDAVRPEAVQRWMQMPLREVCLLNAYGPTETIITATTYQVPPDFGAERSRVPIGKPLPNRAAYILDGHGQPVPVGVAGELYLGGVALARGYLHHPDLTAARFVPDPFSQEPGARLYRTGDLARYLPDGTIEFFGRVDYQLKIRGYRVEPGEIEALLERHPAVREAVVQPWEDEGGDKYLAAYVVSGNGAALPIDELGEYLRDRLPDYMVPSAIVPLDALPTLPTGKVDRRALLRPTDGSRTGTARTYVAPRTPLEEELTRLWAEVLHVERVGVEDNFFDLGGHSLLAAQLASRVREVFQVEVPLRALFESPTVAALSVTIAELQATHMDEEGLGELLDELESLSDEDVQKLLDDETALE